MSFGRAFQALIVEGKNELKYRVVRQFMVCVLSMLRRLYVVALPTVVGNSDDR